MIFEILPTGLFGSNCYILGDNGEGVVIDPGVEAGEILGVAEKNSLKVKYIILTHTHIDHICYMDELRDLTGAKVAVHKADSDTFSNPVLNGSVLMGQNISFKDADIFLKEGDVLEVGSLKLNIIHTPGHTPGGICIKVDNNIFTGDTLFRLSIGRTDLGRGSYEELINSIKSRLMILDDNVKVYPGHNEPTTIGFERKNNPFLT
jgi:glyoxylase-like metal-dependent hydrolase (beta-lactamase superfamily II)